MIIKKAKSGSFTQYQVKVFKTNDAMHKFLNTGSNALTWKEWHDAPAGTKSGSYTILWDGRVFNNKTLDPCQLAHLR